MSGQGAAAAHRIERFERLASTNEEALARARSGDPGGLWIVAQEQTAGRGRHGRPWTSPRGNLHASLLLVDAAPPAMAPQLGFVAGLALHDALGARAPGLPFALKWPNDVLLDGAKLAGVLAEATTTPGGGFACVIGFGVNCGAAPEGLAYPATSLAAAGVTCPPERLIEELPGGFARRFAQWDEGRSFASIRAAWSARAHGLGRAMVARSTAGSIEGVFEGLDESGRMVLHTSSGRVTIDAADVFPLTAKAAATG